MPDSMVITTQHHHAHVASVMAEHGLRGEVLGISFDGTGYGTDGTLWGGEFMVADTERFRRVAHFLCLPMPGGERAIKEPWRMGLSILYRLYGNELKDYPKGIVESVEASTIETIHRLIEKSINSPLTSSVGRLFDGVASILGVRQTVSFEAEAAQLLTELAEGSTDRKTYPYSIEENGTMWLNPLPLVEAMVEDLKRSVSVDIIARRFHNTLVHMVVETADILCEREGLNRVALSGGVFQNLILLDGVVHGLESLGLRVYYNRRIPINDGGLSMGQALIGLERATKD